MLSTKNLPATGKGLPKTIQPGNVVAKILDISLEAGYAENSYCVMLHLETEDPGGSFEGFLVDKDDPNGPRHKGQVGKVKIRLYAFEWEFKGQPVDRDEAILKSLKNLSMALGKVDLLNEINADTIEAYVSQAAKVLSGPTYLNWCIAGKEYMGKDNYTRYELFLPSPVYKNPTKQIAKTELPYESIPAIGTSQLMVYDAQRHILKKKVTTVPGFQVPAMQGAPAAQGDFDLE